MKQYLIKQLVHFINTGNFDSIICALGKDWIDYERFFINKVKYLIEIKNNTQTKFVAVYI